jgi:hypothetical protein
MQAAYTCAFIDPTPTLRVVGTWVERENQLWFIIIFLFLVSQ